MKTRGLVLAALGALGIAGCGGGSHHAGTTAQTAHGGQRGAVSHTVHFSLAASATPLAASIPVKPIATMPSSVPGVTLQLYAAQRQASGAVLIVFGVDQSSAAGNNTFTPEADALSANSAGPSSTATANARNTVSDVSILDPTGLKQYETFMANPSADNTCLCSVITDQINPGVELYAALVAAPPASVTSVSVITGMGTFGNVTLTR